MVVITMFLKRICNKQDDTINKTFSMVECKNMQRIFNLCFRSFLKLFAKCGPETTTIKCQQKSLKLAIRLVNFGLMIVVTTLLKKKFKRQTYQLEYDGLTDWSV